MISLRRSTIAAGMAWIAALLLTACGSGDESVQEAAPGGQVQDELDAAMEKAMADVPADQRPTIERGDDGEIRYTGKTESGESFAAQLGGDVVLPEGFAEAIPLYPDSVPFSAMETGGGTAMVTVNSEDTEATIYKYYQEKLPAAGWEIENEVNVGGGRILNAVKGDQRAVVHIQDVGDGSRIGFMVGPQS
jgi:hypothetical protein